MLIYKKIIAAVLAFSLAVAGLTGCGTAGTTETSGNTGNAGNTGTTSGTGDDDDYISRDGFALDTTISIRIYGTDDEDLLTECMTKLADYDNMLSRTKEGSEIYELNENGEADVSDETLALIKEGLYYSELSGGAFDITIEPVSCLWDFTSGEGTLPDADKLAEAVTHVDYTKVQIDGNHVSMEEGMGIDLGAIAKGYIADQLKSYLEDNGVECGLINLGGNVLCIGSKPSGANFGIGIRNPLDESSVRAAVSVSGKSVVTSGTYERYITVDGKRYHHILNPRTGYSYENDLSSVTIVSDTSVEGDGLSTTCFALGTEEGLKLINGMDGVYAMFIDNEGNITYSDGFEEDLQVEVY